MKRDAQRGKRGQRIKRKSFQGVSLLVCGHLGESPWVIEAISDVSITPTSLCLRAACSTFKLYICDMNGFLSRRESGKRADRAGHLLAGVLLYLLSLSPSVYHGDGWQPFPSAGERPRDVRDCP